MLDQKYLKSVLHYDQNTGIFIWKISPINKIRINSLAGTPNEKGYIKIRINKKYYKAHRLAWFYVYGCWPENDIDHINHNKSDNRLINLREATKSENRQNQINPQSNNTSGFLGVSFHNQTQKFRAQIKFNGKTKSLGLFDTPEDASEAYLKAKRDIHPFSTL